MRPSIVNLACLKELIGHLLTIYMEHAADSKHKDNGKIYEIQLSDAYVTCTGDLVLEGMNYEAIMEHIDGTSETIEDATPGVNESLVFEGNYWAPHILKAAGC